MINQWIELTFVRHGETDWNKQHRIQGQIDIPLNATGFAKAAAVAETLKLKKFNAIVSSDLSRAKQTAEPLSANGPQIFFEPRLLERHLGILDGLTAEEASQQTPKDMSAFKNRSYANTPAGAESMHDLTTRIRTSLTTIHHKFKKGNILVITHCGVIDVLWRLANNIKPESIEKPIIRNGSIHQLIYNPDSKEIFIESFNKTNHLDCIAALDDL